SEEHTSELQSHLNLVCRLLLEKKKVLGDLLLDLEGHLPFVRLDDGVIEGRFVLRGRLVAGGSIFFFNDAAATEIYTFPYTTLFRSSTSARRASAGSPGSRSTCPRPGRCRWRSEEHTSELQSHLNLVCRLLLEKKKKKNNNNLYIKKKTNIIKKIDK